MEISDSSFISKILSDLAESWKDVLESIGQLLMRSIDFPKFVGHASSFFSNEASKHTEDFDAYFKKAQMLGEINILYYSPLEMTLKSIYKYDKDYCLLLSKYERKLMESLEAINTREIITHKSMKELLFGNVSSDWHEFNKSAFSEELIVQIEASVKDQKLQYFKNLWRSLRNQFSLQQRTAIPQDITGKSQVTWKVPKDASQAILQTGRNAVKYFTSNQQIAMWMNEECIFHKNICTSGDLVSDFC